MAPKRVLITGAAGQIGYALCPMVARGAMLCPDQEVILHLLDIEPAKQSLEGVKMELLDAALPLLKGEVWICAQMRGVRGAVANPQNLQPERDVACLHAPPLSLSSLIHTPNKRTHNKHQPDTPNPHTQITQGVVATTDLEEACKGVDVAVMVGGFPRKAGMERKDVMGKNVSIYAGQAKALEAHASKDVKVRVWLVGRVLGGGGHIVSLRGTSGTDDARSLQHKPHNNKLKRCWSSPTRPTPTR